MDLIPVNDLKRHNAPLLSGLRETIHEVLESGWYILGRRVREFEEAYAGYCGTPHCIATANGTDALEIALRACGTGAGDRVATVANAGGYSTAAITMTGAQPLFVEIDPESLLMSPDALKDALRQGVKAIIATHLYGKMLDMRRLLDAAGGVPVIEDGAQAHGAILDGCRAGSWGTIGCFSFYPTKNLGALGDGGALVTSCEETAARLRRLAQYGWSAKYRSSVPGGRNSRLDELQAAVLLYKLPYVDAWNERRRTIARRYREAIAGLPVRTIRWQNAEYTGHLFVVRVAGREAFRGRMKDLGVATDVHYPIPDHRQLSAAGSPWAEVSLPATELACSEVVTLPCFPELTDQEVDRVARAVAVAASQ